jgi:hypothetical protein
LLSHILTTPPPPANVVVVVNKGYFANVKWSHVMVLVMMTGGALIPFLMMAGDLLGPKISAAINNVSDVGLTDEKLASSFEGRVVKARKKKMIKKRSDFN